MVHWVVYGNFCSLFYSCKYIPALPPSNIHAVTREIYIDLSVDTIFSPSKRNMSPLKWIKNDRKHIVQQMSICIFVSSVLSFSKLCVETSTVVNIQLFFIF